MDRQAQFQKLDAAMQRLALTNTDIAILLQVTPAMVSRYRKDATKIGSRGDPDKLTRAAKAVKWLRSEYGVARIRELKPRERAAVCVAAMEAVAPELEVKTPLLR